MSTAATIRVFVNILLLGYISGEYKRVCYYTSWAQYRPAPFKYFPKDIDPFLCTHIIYAFGKVVGLEIKPYEWNDEGTSGMFQKTMDHKRQNPNLKVLLAIGGWTHGSEPFTKMVKTDGDIDQFVKNSIEYLRGKGFDGLDLDWEYPANRGSPPGDKKRFTELVKRLREGFEKEAGTSGNERLLLTAAVAAGKSTVDTAYEIADIARDLDFINLMAYDLHGSWEDFTGHQSPLYARSDEVGNQQFLNQDWAARYWIDNGTPKEKLILGIGTYGRSYKLTSQSNHELGAPASGAGSSGKYTNAAGFLAYYEICANGWTTVWSDEHKVPYAYYGDQWVGYDNVKSVEIKAQYIVDNGLGGAMFWALDLDDFNNQACSEGPYPLLSAVKRVLTTASPPTNAPTVVPTDTSSDYKIVCYFTSWAHYRKPPVTYETTNIDPFLCTHIIYAFSKVDDTDIVEIDPSDEEMYAQIIGLKKQNPSLNVLLSIGGGRLGSALFTKLVSSDSNIEVFAHNAINYLRARGFDGLDLDWEYPAKRGSPRRDKQRFTKWIQVLKEKFVEEAAQTGNKQLILTAAVGAGMWTARRSYEIGEISKYLDFINLMSYSMHGQWESFIGHHSPLFPRSNEIGNQRTINANWSVNHWIENGTPPEKLILGVGTYGKSFTLRDANNYMMGAPNSGAGLPGPYVKVKGLLSFYEICEKIEKDGWTEAWQDEHKVPYAYKNDQWVGFDNERSVEIKAKFIEEKKLGGAMFWALDLDDFTGMCGLGKYPLITKVKDVLRKPAVPIGPDNAGPSVGDFRKVCYVSNKAQYISQNIFKVDDIDGGLCTHIVYKSAKIENRNIFPTEINDLGDSGLYSQLRDLRKRNPGLKVLLGVEENVVGSYILDQMLISTEDMEELGVNILLYVRKHGFDGVDIMLSPGSFSREMLTNFIKFFHDLVTLEADARSQEKLIISIRVSPFESDIRASYDVPTMSKYVDFVNVATFGFDDDYETTIFHGSPLTVGDSRTPSNLNVEAAVISWINAGLSRQKLVLGIPAYGNTYSISLGKHTIGSPAFGLGSPGTYTRTNGLLAYYEVCQNIANGWVRVFDTETFVPHAYSSNTWVGYDDTTSVALKTKYAINEDLGGVMLDDISMDDFYNNCGEGTFPLLNSINDEVAKAPKKTTAQPQTTVRRITTKPVTSRSTTSTTRRPTTTRATTTTTTTRPTTTTRKPTTTNAAAGFCNANGKPCTYADDFSPDVCNRRVYYRCLHGKLLQRFCNSVLVWNPIIKACSWS